MFKDGVRVVTESGSSSRYFSHNETRDLFTLGPPGKTGTGTGTGYEMREKERIWEDRKIIERKYRKRIWEDRKRIEKEKIERE